MQFFAPESIREIKEKVLIRNMGAKAQIPFGKPVDFTPYYSHFWYTACQEDCAFSENLKSVGPTHSNPRQIAQAKLMYRILPHGKAQMPIFRVGAAYMNDGCDLGSGIYNCPVNFRSISVAADYIFVTGKYRYGVFASYPITRISGDGVFPKYPGTSIPRKRCTHSSTTRCRNPRRSGRSSSALIPRVSAPGASTSWWGPPCGSSPTAPTAEIGRRSEPADGIVSGNERPAAANLGDSGNRESGHGGH